MPGDDPDPGNDPDHNPNKFQGPIPNKFTPIKPENPDPDDPLRAPVRPDRARSAPRLPERPDLAL